MGHPCIGNAATGSIMFHSVAAFHCNQQMIDFVREWCLKSVPSVLLLMLARPLVVLRRDEAACRSGGTCICMPRSSRAWGRPLGYIGRLCGWRAQVRFLPFNSKQSRLPNLAVRGRMAARSEQQAVRCGLFECKSVKGTRCCKGRTQR